MRVYRIHIKPGGGNAARSFAFCLKKKVLGVGWPVSRQRESPLTWERYEKLALKKYGKKEISRVYYFHNNVKPKDLIWTRDTVGKYYLAKVTATRGAPPSDTAWRYLDTPEALAADVVNVVNCHIVPIPGVDDVTGKIVACFRPSRVIQAISDETAVRYSQLLWNRLIGREEYRISDKGEIDIFSLLDAEGTEDVIFVYLQYHGWVLVPHSRKADTKAYEFIAIHKATKMRAIVQVKTGHTALATNEWGSFKETVFLFQALGLYTGQPTRNVKVLKPEKIEKFMSAHEEIMPHSVARWLTYARTPGN